MSPRIQIEADLFVAYAAEGQGDRNWTLATRLGDMLGVAEMQFGPRDPSYTILGIEFAGTRPMIWYPGDCKHIVIQLTEDCLTDLPRACYQLAHECIHLLSPTGQQHAINLEEGLATLYGEEYATQWFNTPRNCGTANYERAKSAAARALSRNPAFIREIRRHKPSFNDFTVRDIVERTGVTVADAEFLVTPFAWEKEDNNAGNPSGNGVRGEA